MRKMHIGFYFVNFSIIFILPGYSPGLIRAEFSKGFNKRLPP